MEPSPPYKTLDCCMIGKRVTHWLIPGRITCPGRAGCIMAALAGCGLGRGLGRMPLVRVRPSVVPPSFIWAKAALTVSWGVPCSVFLNGMVPIMTSAGTSRAWPGPDGVATNCNVQVKVCYLFPSTDQLQILLYEKKFRLQILISFFYFYWPTAPTDHGPTFERLSPSL